MAKPEKARRTKKSRYSVHPGVATVQNWVATLKEKTGRSLQEWIELVKRSGPKSENERREWLKKEHGLGTNSAWWIGRAADIDAEVKKWLKIAYEKNGKTSQ